MKRNLALFSFVMGLAILTTPRLNAQWSIGFATGMDQRMEVRNDSGFWCEITAANAPIVVLAPGERALDVRRYQASMEQMPVWAVCYKDASRGQYVGVTASLFDLMLQRPTSNCWIVRNEMLRGPNGGIVDTKDAPPVVPITTPKKVKIPGGNVLIGTFVNIFNNSPYILVIEAEGKSRGTLLPGKIFPGWMVGDYYSTPQHITITAIQTDRNVGMWSTTINPQSSSGSNMVTSQVFCLESKDFR